MLLVNLILKWKPSNYMLFIFVDCLLTDLPLTKWFCVMATSPARVCINLAHRLCLSVIISATVVNVILCLK